MTKLQTAAVPWLTRASGRLRGRPSSVTFRTSTAAMALLADGQTRAGRRFVELTAASSGIPSHLPVTTLAYLSARADA